MCPTQLTDCPSRCAENSGDVTWDHPLDGPTRAKIAAARQAHAAKAAAQGPTAAGGISASVPDFAAAMTGGVAGQAAARSTGAATGAGAGANTGAGLSRMISHQEILSQPTPGASSLPSSDAEAKLASDLEAARQARTEAEKELAAATRAREAEARERQLLTNMVETMQSQLADARQEARELRASQTEMERARQTNWDQQMSAHSRISELEAEVRELRRETADGGSVALMQQRVVEAERTAEEERERGARLRGETANAQLMGQQGAQIRCNYYTHTALALRVLYTVVLMLMYTSLRRRGVCGVCGPCGTYSGIVSAHR